MRGRWRARTYPGRYRADIVWGMTEKKTIIVQLDPDTHGRVQAVAERYKASLRGTAVRFILEGLRREEAHGGELAMIYRAAADYISAEIRADGRVTARSLVLQLRADAKRLEQTAEQT